MHTDKAIAEFDAWWDRQPFREQFEDVKDQMRNVWVASRRELVIDLPEDGTAKMSRFARVFVCYHWATRRKICAAIEAAGVTVRG